MSMKHRKPARRALRLVHETAWAMAPADVQVVADIAERLSGVAVEGVEAVEARLGRPLGNAEGVSMRGPVAVVPVHGPIFRRANMLTEISGATSIEKLALDIQAADDDPAVDAILLDIDSPGGQADGVIELAEHIRGLGTPVTAYVGAKGASGAYALAAAADRVVVAKSAMLGSVGVVVTIRPDEADGSLEVVSSQSPDKRLDAGTDEGLAKVQAIVDRLAAELIGTVAELRGIDAKDVTEWRGGIKVGVDAVAAGMADGVGSFEGVLAALQTSEGEMPKTTSGTDISRAYLEEHHADLVAEIQAEAVSKIRGSLQADAIAGVAQEAARIRCVLEVIDPNSEKRFGELAAMLWDGKTSAADAAIKVLAAERAKGADYTAAVTLDTPAPVVSAIAPQSGAAKPQKTYETPEEKDQAEWDAGANGVRDRFVSMEGFLAYQKANREGRIRRAPFVQREE